MVVVAARRAVAVATSPQIARRVIGLYDNDSRRTAEELDGTDRLDSAEPEEFAVAMVGVHQRFGSRVLGGCCGTDERHLTAVARRIQRA